MGNYVLIEDPSELSIGLMVYIKYTGDEKFRDHKIRKRILIAEHNIPKFDYMFGLHQDETVEEYQEYRKWLITRINKKELYVKRDTDKEQKRSSTPERGKKGSREYESETLL